MSELPQYRIACITENRYHLLSRVYTSHVDAKLAAAAMAKFIPNTLFQVELKSHDSN